LGFGLFVRACFSVYKQQTRFFHFILGTFLLCAIKPYVFICLLPAIAFYFTWKKVRVHPWKWSSICTIFSIFILILLGKILFGNPVSIISRKQADFINVGQGGLYFVNDSSFYYFKPKQFANFKFHNGKGTLTKDTEGELIHFGSHRREICLFKANKQSWEIYFKRPESGSYFAVTPIHESGLQLLKNIPEAFVNCLFRPFPNDGPHSFTKWLILIETWSIFLFIGWGFARKPKLTNEQKSWIVSLSIFIALLAIIVGWIVPIIGAIIRYRLSITIALVIMVSTIWEGKKSVDN
jgi:hypothetical protein